MAPFHMGGAVLKFILNNENIFGSEVTIIIRNTGVSFLGGKLLL